MRTKWKYAYQIWKSLGGVHPRLCPGCNRLGNFQAFGMPPRFDAKCPKCGSLERHRLFVMTDQRHRLINSEGTLLHIAPEPVLRDYLKPKCAKYMTLDLNRTNVDLKEPIEKTSLPDESIDQIVCSHVLEHVEDRKALKEMFRILRRGGTLLVMIPIVEGSDQTYEDPSITSVYERDLHFGQGDHVRLYGKDFRERVLEAGFSVSEFTAQGPDVIKFGLENGEKVFVATKA